MNIQEEFETIRAYEDHEIKEKFAILENEPNFMRLISYLYPELSSKGFVKLLNSFTSVLEFQEQIVYPYLLNIVDKTSKGLTGGGFDTISKDESCFYISNHRDIVLDSAFLNILLLQNGLNTTEIAIGDNLLIYPWIEHLVRLNKSFIVNRNVPVRQMYEVSRRLSGYINYTMKEKHSSVWMAQREGRSKDANDRTHEGVLKMLNMSGEGNFIENMRNLNFVPVAISYEYDPCDYLKAAEFLNKRDNPDFQKNQKDDLKSMSTGLMGYKGQVHFQICKHLNQIIDEVATIQLRNDQISATAGLIDREIHLNYRFYPGNYVAYDLLKNGNQFADKYSPEEKAKFVKYINNQIARIEGYEKEVDFLSEKLFEMYSNPLVNHFAAKGIILD